MFCNRNKNRNIVLKKEKKKLNEINSNYFKINLQSS